MPTISRRGFLATSGPLAAASAMTGTVASGTTAFRSDVQDLPRVRQQLVDPPFVPDHAQVAEGGPKVVEVELVVREDRRVIDDDGTEIHALSFNGSIPGPLIVCHEGDYVELTLQNPAGNRLLHNIDFHASTGALGGGALTAVRPGEQVVLRWKAIKAGTFIYHCAPGGSMIPYHVVSGMNGAVMVLPRNGLEDRDGSPIRYDRAYYVGEQDYYVPRDADGNFATFDYPPVAETLDAMRTLTPSHVGVQRQGGRTDRGRRHDGARGRARPLHPLAGQPGLETAPDRRTRGLRLGTGLFLRSSRPRARDLVHPRRLGRRGDLHVPAAGPLRVSQPQPDRGGRTGGAGPCHGRGRMGRRSHDAGDAPRSNRRLIGSEARSPAARPDTSPPGAFRPPLERLPRRAASGWFSGTGAARIGTRRKSSGSFQSADAHYVVGDSSSGGRGRRRMLHGSGGRTSSKRWEREPGSDAGRFRFVQDTQEIVQRRADNVFLIKAGCWMSP